MRSFTTTAPWLLLFVAFSVVHAQLRGDSTQRSIQQDLLVNETSMVLGYDDVVEEKHLVIDELEGSSFGAISNRSDTTRRLSGEHMMFERLTCNSPCSSFTTWKTENYGPQAGKVTIPCGKCVRMDYDASSILELPHGLNIEGTLRFPNGYKITIKTPFVHVQGNLEMFSQGKVNGQPNIKFILTGTNELITSFVPAANNKFACSHKGATNAAPCFVGKKPFIVAGGRVTIRGVPNRCATWTHLEDITRAELPAPTEFTKLPALGSMQSSPTCSTFDTLIADDFSTNKVHSWTGGFGALFEVTKDGSFLVSDRKDSLNHGPTFDLRRLRDCIIAGQTYLFRARIRLIKTGTANGTLTTCAKTDSYCLLLHSTVKTTTSQYGSRMGTSVESKAHAWRYGEWQDFYTTGTFTEDDISADNVFQIFQFRGPEPGVDIEMDDVLFALPSSEAVPNPSDVCGGNLVLNGDAELDPIHPYPLENQGGVLTVEEEPNGNKYFHQYARTADGETIFHVFDAPGCLVANGKYKVSARIRVNSNTPVASRIEFRSEFTDGTKIVRTIAECDASSSSSWTTCETPFTLLEELTNEKLQEIRLQFRTIDAPNADVDLDDIKLELVNGSISSIIVPDDDVGGCWDAGAEILITSHTLEHDHGQVRKLVSPPTRYGDGFVKLELDAAIIPATTRKQSQDFAVEVALLSRNIVFEGDTDDSDSLMGAHFMVMHTPDVDQLIEGIEFVNFGQQGILGKYPIHFHMCGNVEGALVARNSIRQSNQRCVVVHGTHKLRMTDNVAYDNAGHCFMTEDGGEVDNVFLRNLGASTHAVLTKNVLGPMDSDDRPSTFWCSNPQNEWVGNVAAGSTNNGFWFELQTAVRGPTAEMPLSEGMDPRSLNLKLFRDNVAHSNGQHGLRLYPFGFMPEKEAVFTNTRSFRNKQEGVFIHNSRNIAVEGGVLADNRKQFDFDRAAENIRLHGASLIGVTEQFKYVTNTQPEATGHSSVVGIELHGFTLNGDNDGASITDIAFSGFAETQANHSALFEIDADTTHGNFDFWTTLKGVTVSDDVTPAQFDFRSAMANGIDNVYLTDIGSGMRPAGVAATNVSTVISNTPAMSHFLDLNKCRAFPERAYMYCSNTCLRTVLLSVPPSMTDDFVLRINKEGFPGNFIEVDGKFDNETLNRDGSGGPDEVANSWLRKRRYFAASLPDADYVFRLYRGGKMDWPTSVEVTFEKPQCDTSLTNKRVSIGEPSPSASTCSELIKNGDMEMSTTDYPYWLHHESGLSLAPGKGISGSTALSEIDPQAPVNGLVGQFLDTRCLQKGKQYEVRAWVKVMRNGAPYDCDPANNCPTAGLKLWTAQDADGSSFSESNIGVVYFFERPYDRSGWNLLRGTFTVDKRIESASSVLLFVERGRRGITMLIDNVSVSPVAGTCNELVFNGDFDGNSGFWQKRVASTTMVMKNGNSLKMTDRNSLIHSPEQDIRVGCMRPGDRFVATARVRLENTDGSMFGCDPTRTTGNVCPRMRIKSFVDEGLPSFDSSLWRSVAVTDHGRSNGWYILSGVFSAEELDKRADRITLAFDRVSAQKDFVIDNVSIKPLLKDCSNLFLNGDAEYGDTPSFWSTWGANGNERISVVSAGAGNHAFKIDRRDEAGDGIQQFVDPRCLVAGSVWKLVARMKLVSKTTGKGVTCDASDERVVFGCPPVRILGWTAGNRGEDQPFYMTNRPSWSANSYNRYEVEFTVNNVLAKSDEVSVGIRGYNDDWDMYIDDIRLVPVV